MDATLDPRSAEQYFPSEQGEKSELMMIFESQVHDNLWAYRDLLKAIFEIDPRNTEGKA